MITQRVSDAVSRTAEIIRTTARDLGHFDVKLQPHPPASKQEIKAYESYLGLQLPPTYRAFLELYDGYDWLAYPGHMLSIASLMPGGSWHSLMMDWKRTAADYGSGEVLDGVPIANLGEPNNWAYLNPNSKLETGEYELCVWLAGGGNTYADLFGFLDSRVLVCRAELTLSRRRRGGAP